MEPVSEMSSHIPFFTTRTSSRSSSVSSPRRSLMRSPKSRLNKLLSRTSRISSPLNNAKRWRSSKPSKRCSKWTLADINHLSSTRKPTRILSSLSTSTRSMSSTWLSPVMITGRHPRRSRATPSRPSSLTNLLLLTLTEKRAPWAPSLTDSAPKMVAVAPSKKKWSTSPHATTTSSPSTCASSMVTRPSTPASSASRTSSPWFTRRTVRRSSSACSRSSSPTLTPPRGSSTSARRT